MRMEIENAIKQHAEKNLSADEDNDDDFEGLTKAQEDHTVTHFCFISKN